MSPIQIVPLEDWPANFLHNKSLRLFQRQGRGFALAGICRAPKLLDFHLPKEAGVSDVMSRRLAIVVLLVALGINVASAEEAARKVRSKVDPTYPVLAKRNRIAGVVKIEVTITPSGTISEKKIIGGNPLLVNSCMDALSKWRFEPGPREDTQVLEFRFTGN